MKKKILTISLILCTSISVLFAHSLTSITPNVRVNYDIKNTLDFGVGINAKINRLNLSLGVLMNKDVNKLEVDFFIGGIPYYALFNEHLISLILALGVNVDLNYKNVNSYLGLSPYGRIGFEYITPFNLNLTTFVDLGYNFAIKGKENNKFDVRVGISIGYSFDVGKPLYKEKDNRYDDIYIGDVEEKIIEIKEKEGDKTDKKQRDEDIFSPSFLEKLLNRLEEVEKENDRLENLLLETKDNVRYIAVKESNSKTGDNTKDIIKENKEKSNITIEGNYNFEGAIARYTYSRSNIYDVFLTPLNITDIRLEKGEEVISVILGDPNNWNTETLQTSETIDGEDVLITHLLLRPLNVNIQTDCMVATDVRVYYLKLYSTSSTYMTALEFTYPHTNNERIARSVRGTKTLSSVDEINKKVNDLVFNYNITGDMGLRPKRVFSDGERTYLQYGNDFYNSGIMPIMYLESEDGTRSLINFTQKGITYTTAKILKNGEKIVLLYDGKEAYIEREY